MGWVILGLFSSRHLVGQVKLKWAWVGVVLPWALHAKSALAGQLKLKWISWGAQSRGALVGSWNQGGHGLEVFGVL